MRPASSVPQAPRPPPPSRTDPNDTMSTGKGAATATAEAAQGMNAMTEMQLRRRLAHMEMRLRDMDEEAKRLRGLQEQELANLARHNTQLRERLEELRMVECLPLIEAQPILQRARQQRGGATVAAPREGGVDSKLVGSTTVKYQKVKELIQERRRQCAHAERQLADTLAELAEVRRTYQALRQRNISEGASGAARVAEKGRYRTHMQERLHGLEEQVAREQDRFSDMANDAKLVRLEIDTLLINEATSEKMYRERYDALLDKRREMAYLMEVCNLLCEERQCIVAELAEMQADMTEESRQYETAFDELTGVLEENTKTQSENREQLSELRRMVHQVRGEREALEQANERNKTALDRQRRSTISSCLAGTSTLSEGATGGKKSENSSAAGVAAATAASATGNKDGVPRGDSEVGSSNSHASSVDSEALEDAFESCFSRLARLVQSDTVSDVVGFLDAAADARYRSFDEMNAIKREIAQLAAEKASLQSQIRGTSSQSSPRHGGISDAASLMGVREDGEAALRRSPSTALTALAAADSLSAVASAAAAAAAERDGNQAIGSSGGQQGRTTRFARLLEDLRTTRDSVVVHEDEHEAGTTILTQVVAQVNEMFHGLGCSVDDLRALTGLEGVQHSTLLQCLALVEQRVTEFLIAFSRSSSAMRPLLPLSQQQEAAEDGEPSPNMSTCASTEGVDTHTSAATAASRRLAARAVLRRPDLPPKAKEGAVVTAVANHHLPRSTDFAAAMHANGAQARTVGAALEEAVEERPLSVEELHALLKARHGTTPS